MKVKVLYATKIGAPNYMEEVISENENNFDDATAWCKDNGFDRINIKTIDLSTPPDFIATINRKK